VRIGESEALIDLRIDPQFGAFPQPRTGIERDVSGLATLPAMRQAVGALKGGADRGIALPDKRGLAVETKVVHVLRGRRFQTFLRLEIFSILRAERRAGELLRAIRIRR
jgi:hypothetical protein